MKSSAYDGFYKAANGTTAANATTNTCLTTITTGKTQMNDPFRIAIFI